MGTAVLGQILLHKRRERVVQFPTRLSRDGIEHERTLAGARHAREYSDLMLGNLERDIFEVVLSRSLNDNGIAFHACKGTTFLENLEAPDYLDQLDYLEPLDYLDYLSPMRIVCDRYIPFLPEAVQTEWGDVEIIPLKPEEIDHSVLREADVLVIRTRTQVNEQLLKGTKVRLVCTATIGYDHIDTAWCDEQDIRWVSCPGSNAQAVCDYVEEVLQEITNHQLQITNTPVLGVVGVGHV